MRDNPLTGGRLTRKPHCRQEDYAPQLRFPYSAGGFPVQLLTVGVPILLCTTSYTVVVFIQYVQQEYSMKYIELLLYRQWRYVPSVKSIDMMNTLYLHDTTDTN